MSLALMKKALRDGLDQRSVKFIYDADLARRIAYRELIVKVYGMRCAWCGEEIEDKKFDAHHWLVSRGMWQHEAYEQINVVINVVPLHKKCHAKWGQTRAMRDRCYSYVSSFFGSQIIDDWLTQLQGE